MLLVALSVPNDAASHVHVIALFDVEGCKAIELLAQYVDAETHPLTLREWIRPLYPKT